MFAARTDPQRTWLDQHHLISNPFGSYTPAGNSSGDWSGYIVDPDNLIGSLRQLGDICLVFGGQGCGKTLSCTALADECWPVRPQEARAALVFGHTALLDMATRCLRAGRLPDQLDFLASVALELHGLAGSGEHSPPSPPAPDAGSRWEALHAACAAVLQRTEPAAPGRLTADRLRDLLLAWLGALGFHQLLLLVDEVDEAALALDGEPDSYFGLVKAVIERPGVWRGREFCCIAFLSAECRDALEAQRFYPRRLRTRSIEWDAAKLVQMLDQRVITSNADGHGAAAFHDLLAPELRSAIDASLCALAAQRPDWALEIATQLIEAHCRASRAQPARYIKPASWASVERAWQAERARRMPHLERVQRLCGGASGSLPPSALDVSARADPPLHAPPADPPPRLEIDEATGDVRLGGRPVDVTAQPYRVLLYLYRHEGKVCTNYNIMAEAWPEDNAEFASNEMLNTTIKRLRQALEAVAPGVVYIENKSKRGYVLWTGGKPQGAP